MLGDKVCLNSKHIKTKQNQKPEAKFFGPFRVLYLVGNQAYKLELLKNWKIYNIFYMSLLEQNTTKKEQVDKTTSPMKLDKSKRKEYKVETIYNSKVYTKELDKNHLLSLSYFISSKKKIPRSLY